MAKSSRTRAPGFSALLRSWRRTYETSARRDGFCYILDLHGYDPGDEGADGESLVEGLVEVVAYMLAARSLDCPLTKNEISHFLERQQYGVTPESGLSVQLGPCPSVVLYVDELQSLDFEDLFGRFGLAWIQITSLQGSVTNEEARLMVDHVVGDLTFDGEEYEFEWNHEPRGVYIEVRLAEPEE